MKIKKPTKATIKEQVYKIIKEMILYQQYSLGEKININTLATDLNVSNSPIREALTMLEEQGLVENIPNVGTCVITFSPSAYREICSTLLIIVLGAYDLCRKQNTLDTAITDMKKTLRQQKNMIDSTDIYTFMKYTLAFDKSIVLATQNSYLLSIYERLEDLFFLMVLHVHQRSFDEHCENIYEHSMILENIEKGDVNTAKEWFQIHYDKEFLVVDNKHRQNHE